MRVTISDDSTSGPPGAKSWGAGAVAIVVFSPATVGKGLVITVFGSATTSISGGGRWIAGVNNLLDGFSGRSGEEEVEADADSGAWSGLIEIEDFVPRAIKIRQIAMVRRERAITQSGAEEDCFAEFTSS
jgi:hypothetical protein